MLDARRLRLFLCLLAGLWMWGSVPVGRGPSTFAQQPSAQEPAPPVFRSGVHFVSVDIYPRRDGSIVEGLRAEDFDVFEDGVPQAIDRFEFIRIDSAPVDSERRDPASQADGNLQAADPRNRLFVVYLDLAHTTLGGGYYARQPVVDFLTRAIGARDLFGVMTSEVPVSQLVFGRRTETIEAELAKHWTWGQANRAGIELRTPYERRISDCAWSSGSSFDDAQVIERMLIELTREDQLMTSLEDLMLRLGGLRDERKNVLFVSEGWEPRGPRHDSANFSVNQGALPRVGVGPGGRMGIGQTTQPFAVDGAWCDAEIGRLRGIDFTHRFRRLLVSANEANVSFYPLDVGGLRATSTLAATSTLRELAENTDGVAIVSTNDLTGGVRRIERELSAFYLLGYYSTNTEANGRFRRIEVKVKQPDVRVSARRGYLAPTAGMVAAALGAGEKPALSEVDEAVGRLSSLRADADLFVSGAATADGVFVAVELSPAAAARAAWRAGGSVEAVATSADGSTTSATTELAAGARSASVTVPVAVGGGPWQIVVRVSGQDERIDQRVDVAARVARWVGAPIAWRGASSPRVPLRPLGDVRLTRLERLRVEWPVIASADSYVARLLDRRGQPLGQPLPFATLPPDRQALAVDLPMGSLSEGDYLIELVASQDGESERRLLAFRVVR